MRRRQHLGRTRRGGDSENTICVVPDYSIYVLDEGDATITGTTGGNGLDGVTQGSGVHLLGATITINTPNWTEIQVSDTDDANFQDSDASQTLNGAQEVDGVTYSGGERVEAEYGFTVTDPDGNTYQLIGFNVNEPGSSSFATIEGIAVIGGPGGFPPAGVPLTVTATQEGPNYAAADYATPICFTAGTLVATRSGLRGIETVMAGDEVRTRAGWREVRWAGQRRVPALGASAPVRFTKGAMGATHQIKLSQQHRVLVTGWQAELMFGEAEVLVPAVALINDDKITLRTGGEVTYVHLLFDEHELIDAQGLTSESLHPGRMALDAVDAAARAEIVALFPELTDLERPLCRPALRVSEAKLLA